MKTFLCSLVLGSTLLAAARAATPSEEIAVAHRQLESALAARDANLLDSLIATQFLWIHSSDGRVDDRDTWLSSATRGMALSGQRNPRSEHGSTLSLHGDPAHTAIRVARVRLKFQNRESWIRQTHVWVRVADGAWKLASGQGVPMYDGPALDESLHSRYAGTFTLSDGRKLVLSWEEPLLLATMPNGARSQVFLGSPTEEVVRNPAAGALRFELDDRGIPQVASLMRSNQEVWRAKRTH